MIANPTRPIRILLVDDHEMVRVGLRALLGRFPELEVVGETSTAATAVAETARLVPDVVLLDARLPDASGLEACRQIRQQDLPTRVVILTAYGDDALVLEAATAGVDGYLLKEIGAEALVNAIKVIALGQSILDPAVTRRVLTHFKSLTAEPSQDKLASLTPQERRLLQLVAEGKTNKEIAATMGLSDKTVKNYLSHVLEKLNLNRRSQAAAYFARHGSG